MTWRHTVLYISELQNAVHMLVGRTRSEVSRDIIFIKLLFTL